MPAPQMATLRAELGRKPVTIELTVEELHRLLSLNRISLRSGAPRGAVRQRAAMPDGSGGGAQVDVSPPGEDLAGAIRSSWPMDNPLDADADLTTANVRRFLLQRVMEGANIVSTAEVAQRFFGRPLAPNRSADADKLRKLWYSLREAKREIERSIGGHWEDATESQLRSGSSRSWKYIQSSTTELGSPVLEYREAE